MPLQPASRIVAAAPAPTRLGREQILRKLGISRIVRTARPGLPGLKFKRVGPKKCGLIAGQLMASFQLSRCYPLSTMTAQTNPPAVPATPAVPAVALSLDAAALARLRDLDPDGRHGVVTRVLTAFEASLSRMLAQLQGERGAHHPAAVAGVAHMLKSSSASVGALSLAKACADVELKLRQGDTSALQADITQLISEGESALQAVTAILRA